MYRLLLLLALGLAGVAADPFADPVGLCSALAGEGLGTRGWKNMDYEYSCTAPYVSFGPTGATGMQSNLAYYVIGDSSKRARQIKLVMNLNAPGGAQIGRTKLASATTALFGKLGQPMPAGLLAAVKAGKPFTAKQAYGNVEHKVERSRIETWSVIVSTP